MLAETIRCAIIAELKSLIIQNVIRSITMLDPCQLFPNVMERFDYVSPPKANGIRWFKCPAHPDHSPSGWAFVHQQSKMLVLKCFRGCGMLVIMQAMGLSRKDVHMETKSELRWIKHAHYDYRYADGRIAFRVVRLHAMDGDEYVKKSFVQQQPLGDGRWADNIKGVVRPLYRLPELLSGLNAKMDRPIFFVEGEGKCDLVRSIGLLATSMNNGANARLEEQQATVLKYQRLVLCQDNDDDGRKWVEGLLYSLAMQPERPRSVAIMTFDEFERHGDVGDFILKLKDGNTKEGIRWELMKRFQGARSLSL